MLLCVPHGVPKPLTITIGARDQQGIGNEEKLEERNRRDGGYGVAEGTNRP